jgi:hypothetical protein
MKHLYKLVCLIFTLSLLVSIDASAQTILVYSEDFENGPGSFVLNTGSVGDSIGPNQWIVNNEYNGQPNYPAFVRSFLQNLGLSLDDQALVKTVYETHHLRKYREDTPQRYARSMHWRHLRDPAHKI